MLSELVNYYKNNLTVDSLVFKYMKSTRSLSICLMFLLMLSGYLLIFTLPFDVIGVKVARYISVVFAIVYFLSALVTYNIGRRAKVILKNRYSIKVEKGIWRTTEFDFMQTQMLKSYLGSKNVYTKEKLERIMIFLEKEIERSKIPTFLAPSIFIAMFIPAWAQYIIFLFKGIEDNNFDEASTLIVILIGVCVFIALAVGTYKKFLHLGEEYLMSERYVKKELLLKIEELLLRLPDTAANKKC